MRDKPLLRTVRPSRRSIGEIEFTESKGTLEDAEGSIDVIPAETGQTKQRIEAEAVVRIRNHERSRRNR